MSRSHHVTGKDLKGFSKKEIDEMVNETYSLLHQLTDKRKTKNDVKAERKRKKRTTTKNIRHLVNSAKNEYLSNK